MALQSSNCVSMILMSFPVMKSAPPSTLVEFLSMETEVDLKLDLLTVTLSPVRHIVPPLELDSL